MQAMLPDVVRAHQQGIGRSAYKRQMGDCRSVIHLDGKYELRRVWELSGRTYRRVWTAWYIGGTTPYRIYDVQGSTVPEEVLGDLMAWITEDHQHMEDA